MNRESDVMNTDELPPVPIQRLILEGRGCRTRTYASCMDFASILITTVGMTEIGRVSHRIECLRNRRDDGVTVNVTFKESHQVFHTWPESQFVLLEITSCREFNEREVVKAFKAFFRPRRVFKGIVTMESI